ncbi:MAG: velvet factor-domain-containing protein [Olpidium bornovanus]|uniref:Velvet factor-domain-containing protein n=1 Tax=Olpidium bornovanus TaxID=278681 RepID=A0A8H8DFS7_9FUNG|nr:MAG: velvet factor-domain-containing protein [Olpidium bornovanus]
MTFVPHVWSMIPTITAPQCSAVSVLLPQVLTAFTVVTAGLSSSLRTIERGSEDVIARDYVLSVSLWSEDGLSDCSAVDQPLRRGLALFGTRSIASEVYDDADGNSCVMFPFVDLSVRCEGIYRLKFCLADMTDGPARSSVVSEVLSEPFRVYRAKFFPGAQPSSPLSVALKTQGLALSIRKKESAPLLRRAGGTGGTAEDGLAEPENAQANEPRR